MDKQSLSEFVPNPLNSRGTLGQYTKAGVTLGQGINLALEIWKAPILLVVAAVLVSIEHLSWWLFWIATPCVFIALFLNIRAFQELRKQPTNNLSSGVLAPFIITRHYQVITSALNTPIVLIFVLTFTKTFASHISPSLEHWVLWLATILVIIVSVVSYFIGVSEVRGYKEAGNVTDTGKAMQVVEIVKNKVGLASYLLILPFILTFLGVMAYFIIHGGPPAQGSIAGGLLALMFMAICVILFPFLYIVSIRRMSSVSLQPGTVTPAPPQNVSQPDGTSAHPSTPPVSSNDEIILEKVLGIMPNYGTVQGVSFMGKGEMKHPENSLIVTNKRLALIQVPMPGGNMIVGDVNYQQENFFFNRGQINDNGEALLASQSLDQIITSNTMNIVINLVDVQEFKLSNGEFKISNTTGEHISYIFMDKIYYDRLVAIIPKLLGNKFKTY